MEKDGRDAERIQRAVSKSRSVYENIGYSRIDTPHLSVEEAAENIISLTEKMTV